MFPIRILLVDDNAEFLESAMRFLAAEPQIQVVGRALSARSGLEQVTRLQPDLVLMDLAMPDMNGLEATCHLKKQPDAPQVVILTLHDDAEYRAAAQSVHADGFVAKSEFGTQLLPVIRSLFGPSGETPEQRPSKEEFEMSNNRSLGTLGAAIAILVGLAALTACAAPPTPAPQFTLRVGIFPVQECLPYFVMRDQGFDKQNGLQFVETTAYPDGTALIKAMGTDSVDAGPSVANVPVLLAAERGLIPVKIVPVAANAFTDPEHPTLGVLAGRSVNNWKDLEGQAIGVASMTSLYGAAMKGRLKQEGVRDYTLVEIPIPNLGLAVAGGNVAAAAMSEPFLTQSLLRGDGKLLGWIIGGPPFERMESTLIVFNADFYKNNPEGIKAYLRAHLQAVKWINQNPDLARSVLVKRLGLTPEIGKQVNLLSWSLDARNDPALLDNTQPPLVETGMLKAPIPARQLYDETLLNQVLAEKP